MIDTLKSAGFRGEKIEWIFLQRPGRASAAGFFWGFFMHAVNQLNVRPSYNSDEQCLGARMAGLLETRPTPTQSDPLIVQEPSSDQFSFDIIMTDGSPRKPENRVELPALFGYEQAVTQASGTDKTATFVKFIVDRATKSAIEGVLTCAMDNAPYWRIFFEQGLADAIAEENALEYMFFEKLCGGIGLPYSADIIEGYLQTLPAHHLEKFLCESLKRKSHPAAKAFIGATQDTVQGRHFLRIIEVFFKYGMCLDPIGARLVMDLERAVCEGNKAFMEAVIPQFSSLPVPLLCTVMAKAPDPARIVNILVEVCGIPLETFSDPKILAEAQPRARDYVLGLMARRAEREPERIIERMDEDLLLSEIPA